MDIRYIAYLLDWLIQYRLDSSQNNVLHAGEAVNPVAAQHTKPEVSAVSAWHCRPRGYPESCWSIVHSEKQKNQDSQSVQDGHSDSNGIDKLTSKKQWWTKKHHCFILDFQISATLRRGCPLWCRSSHTS